MPVPVRLPLLAVTALLALGCVRERRGPLQTREDMFAWRDVVPAGGTVRVREMRGAIEVVPSADDTVRVTARIEWRTGDPTRDLAFSASPGTDDLLICAVWGDGRCSRDGYTANLRAGRRGRGRTDAKVFFRVEVPAGVALDLTNIDGDITAAASAPVRARTMNGSVTVATAVGPVRAESMNGNVDARMMSLRGTDSVVVKTMNGDAYAFLPEHADVTVDMSVTNGSLLTDFPVADGERPDRRRLRSVLGSGASPVYIHSINGRVGLRRLDAEGRSYP
jgi:hypothetical protein